MVRSWGSTFFLGRNKFRFYIRHNFGFALFTFEPVILISEALNLFGLAFYPGRKFFYLVHEIENHLTENEILD